MRSIQFSDALAARQWTAIPQTGHPGLTTMALGALGIQLTRMVSPVQAEEHLAWIRNVAWLAPEVTTAFPRLAYFLPAGRALVALTTSLGVVLAYLSARSRLGASAARWLALFLALDPFLSGHSGLLHTDALQAIAALLAALLVLPRRQQETTTLSLVGAGLCLALAGLTKTLGLLIAPGLALLTLLQGRRSLTGRVAGALLLTLVTLCATFAGYPPLWSDPVSAIGTLVGAAEYHSGIGLRDVFFAGYWTADPGLLFYPVVLLFRLTPPVLVGLLGTSFNKARRSLRGALWLAVPMLSYLLGLVLATKKFDRYALTLTPLAAALAAGYWVRKASRWRPILAAALLLPWAVVAVVPLYYSNPLLGGPWLARHVIPLGWGEASGFAARLADRLLSDPDQSTLLAMNVPGSAPFFSGTTWAWNDRAVGCTDALVGDGSRGSETISATTDISVAGLRLTQLTTQRLVLPERVPVLAAGRLPGGGATWTPPRASTADVQAWLNEQIPPGASFLWVHAPECYPVTETQLRSLIDAAEAHGSAVCAAAAPVGDFEAEVCVLNGPLENASAFQARIGGHLDLLAVAAPEAVQAPDVLMAKIRWRALGTLDELRFHLSLVDADGSVAWAESGNLLLDARNWPTSRWPVGEIVDAEVYLPIAPDLPPATYRVMLSLSDLQGQLMGITHPDGAFGGTRYSLGEVVIQPAGYPAPTLDLAVTLDAAVPGLALIGASELPSRLSAGEPLPFRLGWERLSGNAPAVLDWELTCANGASDRGTLAIAPQSPTAWPSGHRYVSHYAPRTSPYLGNGPCTLVIHLSEERSVIVGTVDLAARGRRFELPDQPQVAASIDLERFGRLIGISTTLTGASLRAGESLEVTLFFAAAQAAGRDYTVFVHAVGPDGRVWAQSDLWPEAGNAPTASWVERQIIVDTHHLALPADAVAGSYTLVMGMYDATDGVRVALYGANGDRLPQDHALVGSFEVTP